MFVRGAGAPPGEARSEGARPPFNAARGAGPKPGENARCAALTDQRLSSVPSVGLSAARLASGLRGLWGADGKAVACCRLKRIAPEVQLVAVTGEHGSRVEKQGLATCKSPLCPLCAGKWARTRSEEITRAIDHWGARRVLFLTLTARHHPGMPLALQHRILTRAYGHLWSGRQGQAHAEQWGGKPESIRAHDRTWSAEYGWHPHLHALVFRRSEAQTIAELSDAMIARWPAALASALRAMKRFCRKTLARAGEWDLIRRCFPELPQKRRERTMTVNQWELAARAELRGWCLGRGCTCETCTRERAKRMFGGRLVRKSEPLLDAIRRISLLLRAIDEASLMPSEERGVKMETVRAEDRAPTYLAKLGLELAFSESKHVHERTDKHGRLIRHYPHWGVAHLATRHGTPLRALARKAWAELFTASRGTQTITFSDRAALGLGPDPYAEDGEPPEAGPTELVQLLGQIAGDRWDTLRREQGHGLLVTIEESFLLGVLPDLPFVDPPLGHHGLPESRGPPKPPYHRPEGIHWAIALNRAEERGRAQAHLQVESRKVNGSLLSVAVSARWTWRPLQPRETRVVWDVPALLVKFQRAVQLGLRFEPW